MKHSWITRHRILVYFLILGNCFLLSFARPGVAHASSGNFTQYTFNESAGSLSYFVYTPANYQVGTTVPMIVMLHGCGGNSTEFANLTQMNVLADQKQFIVVYPQQSILLDPALCWNFFLTADQSRGSREPSLIAGITQAVEQTTSQWTIDPRRVYVAGFSAGAGMAAIMGATYSDLFAAIGLASGWEYQVLSEPTLDLNLVNFALTRSGPDATQQGQAAFNAMGSAARVVPTIDFQGQSDLIATPINGDQVIQQWMETDRLASHGTYTASFSSPTTTTTVGQVPGLLGHPYTVQTWNDAHGNEIEEYWKIFGMGHAWSGTNTQPIFTDPFGPSATNAIYTFFLNHPKNCARLEPLPPFRVTLHHASVWRHNCGEAAPPL